MRAGRVLSRAGRVAILRPMTEPGGAPPLTRDALRVLAQARGLSLDDRELDGLLPLVVATRALMDEMAAAPLGDVEPTAQFHML